MSAPYPDINLHHAEADDEVADDGTRPFKPTAGGPKTQCSNAAMAYCGRREFDAPSVDREPCTYTRHIFRSPIPGSRNRSTVKWSGCRSPIATQRGTSYSYGRMRNRRA